jgi:hypothetical protein
MIRRHISCTLLIARSIGRLKGAQVAATDISKRKLKSAGWFSEDPDGCFRPEILDGSFATATAFYALMFMPASPRANL